MEDYKMNNFKIGTELHYNHNSLFLFDLCIEYITNLRLELCLAVAALADIGQLRLDLIVFGRLLVRVVVVVEDNGSGFLIGDSMSPQRLDGQALVNALGQTLEVDDHDGVVVFGFDQLQRIERERERES